MFDDDEIKEIDDTLSAKEAEAFAKQVASEAKKKKRLPRKMLFLHWFCPNL